MLGEPMNVICRINMIVLIFMLLIKTFFFLRIFVALSYLEYLAGNYALNGHNRSEDFPAVLFHPQFRLLALDLNPKNILGG